MELDFALIPPKIYFFKSSLYISTEVTPFKSPKGFDRSVLQSRLSSVTYSTYSVTTGVTFKVLLSKMDRKCFKASTLEDLRKTVLRLIVASGGQRGQLRGQEK